MATASNAISLSGLAYHQAIINGQDGIYIPIYAVETAESNSYAELYIVGTSGNGTNNTFSNGLGFYVQYYNTLTASWDNNPKQFIGYPNGTDLGTYTFISEAPASAWKDGLFIDGFGSNSSTDSRQSTAGYTNQSLPKIYSIKLFPGMRISYRYTTSPSGGGTTYIHYRAMKFING